MHLRQPGPLHLRRYRAIIACQYQYISIRLQYSNDPKRTVFNCIYYHHVGFDGFFGMCKPTPPFQDMQTLRASNIQFESEPAQATKKETPSIPQDSGLRNLECLHHRIGTPRYRYHGYNLSPEQKKYPESQTPRSQYRLFGNVTVLVPIVPIPNHKSMHDIQNMIKTYQN